MCAIAEIMNLLEPGKPNTKYKTMKNTIITTSIVLALSAASANAAVLYNISSFNNDGSTGTTQWKAGITTITTAAGLTGTTDAELPTLQTISATPITSPQVNVLRFANLANPDNLIADTGGYFQFGITDNGDVSNNMDLTSLTFQAMRATTGTSVRGYTIEVSVDGGTYSLLGDDTDFTSNRNDGLESVTISLAGAAFQGASSVDFQVTGNGGGMEYTNFAINGDIVAVPEPSSTALLGLGGLALFLRRRK